MAMDFRDSAHGQRTLAILIIAACVLQVAIAPQISILGGRFNFMIALAGSVALMGKPDQAVFVGFGAGLLYDLTSPVPVGLMTLILTVGSFALVQLSSAGTSGLSSTSMRFMGVFALAVCLVNGIALLLLGTEHDILLSLGGHGLMTAVLSTVASVPFIMLSSSMGPARTSFSARGRGTRFKSASRGRGRGLR
ncbi:hypothetical protein [Enorma burkinafasonensis]|uniref:hypothetical protein n=1 Tax=Enorma burkinafasonensis TaxID=2590867 RepID=UPI0026EA706C|nr:hypothetical protein [Enorma burkinafasonensis]MCI7730811.1 hypothetical protein [Enorma burkinafasonensis]